MFTRFFRRRRFRWAMKLVGHPSNMPYPPKSAPWACNHRGLPLQNGEMCGDCFAYMPLETTGGSGTIESKMQDKAKP